MQDERFIHDWLTKLYQQREGIARLERLGARQARLIRAEDTEALRPLLAERSELLTWLASITEQCLAYRRHSRAGERPCSRAGERPSAPAEVERLSAENQAGLRRVLEAGQADLRVLAVKKNTAGELLRSTRAATTAVDAYRARVRGSGRLDLVNGESS